MHFPLHTIPLPSLLKEICGSPRGKCDFKTFRFALGRILKNTPKLNDQHLLQVLYNALDRNHDGNIDVNELCNSMIVFYPPESYRADARIWRLVSKVNWIPQEECIKNLSGLAGVDPQLVRHCVKGVNVEGNPNITFAQFLRAKDAIPRKNLENLIPAKGGAGGANGPLRELVGAPPGSGGDFMGSLPQVRGVPSLVEHDPGFLAGGRSPNVRGVEVPPVVIPGAPPRVGPALPRIGHPVVIRSPSNKENRAFMIGRPGLEGGPGGQEISFSDHKFKLPDTAQPKHQKRPQIVRPAFPGDIPHRKVFIDTNLGLKKRQTSPFMRSASPSGSPNPNRPKVVRFQDVTLNQKAEVKMNHYNTHGVQQSPRRTHSHFSRSRSPKSILSKKNSASPVGKGSQPDLKIRSPGRGKTESNRIRNTSQHAHGGLGGSGKKNVGLRLVDKNAKFQNRKKSKNGKIGAGGKGKKQKKGRSHYPTFLRSKDVNSDGRRVENGQKGQKKGRGAEKEIGGQTPGFCYGGFGRGGKGVRRRSNSRQRSRGRAGSSNSNRVGGLLQKTPLLGGNEAQQAHRAPVSRRGFCGPGPIQRGPGIPGNQQQTVRISSRSPVGCCPPSRPGPVIGGPPPFIDPNGVAPRRKVVAKRPLYGANTPDLMVKPMIIPGQAPVHHRHPLHPQQPLQHLQQPAQLSPVKVTQTGPLTVISPRGSQQRVVVRGIVSNSGTSRSRSPFERTPSPHYIARCPKTGRLLDQPTLEKRTALVSVSPGSSGRVIRLGGTRKKNENKKLRFEEKPKKLGGLEQDERENEIGSGEKKLDKEEADWIKQELKERIEMNKKQKEGKGTGGVTYSPPKSIPPPQDGSPGGESLQIASPPLQVKVEPTGGEQPKNQKKEKDLGNQDNNANPRDNKNTFSPQKPQIAQNQPKPEVNPQKPQKQQQLIQSPQQQPTQPRIQNQNTLNPQQTRPRPQRRQKQPLETINERKTTLPRIQNSTLPQGATSFNNRDRFRQRKSNTIELQTNNINPQSASQSSWRKKGLFSTTTPSQQPTPQSNLKEGCQLSQILICRIPLGLNNIDCRELSGYLSSALRKSKSKSLSLTQFRELMTVCKPVKIDQDVYEHNLNRLFTLLDANQNQKLEQTELANAMILLAGGDKKSKIEAAFRFYDKDKNGVLTFEEMVDYFVGVLKLKWLGDNKHTNRLDEQSVKKIAAATVKKCFDSVDLNHDGTISIKEFTEWILNGGETPSVDNAEKFFRKNLDEKALKKQRLESQEGIKEMIDRLRIGLPFQKVHISIALFYLKEEGGSFVSINKKAFREYLKRLIKGMGIAVKFGDGFDSIPTLFFKVFDLNNNGILDKEELGVGLFLLCGKQKHPKRGIIEILRRKIGSNFETIFSFFCVFLLIFCFFLMKIWAN